MVRTGFLFGGPGSVEEVDPGEKEPKTFELTEGAWNPGTCWCKRSWPGVAGRPPRQLPSRQDVPHLSPRGQAVVVVVGSFNFTRRGLGGGDQPNNDKDKWIYTFFKQALEDTSKKSPFPHPKSLLAHAKPLHYWLSPGERGFHGEDHPIFRGALEKIELKHMFTMQVGRLIRDLDESSQNEWWNVWLKNY